MTTLTKDDVLRLTAPDGMSIDNWAEMLTDAKECERVWADPWAGGSPGWEDFIGRDYLAREHARDAGRWTAANPRPSRNADREEWRVTLAEYGPKKNVRLVLDAMADYGKDDGTDIFVSNSRIAGDIGVRREAVNRNVKDGVAQGWIYPDGKVGRQVRYRLSVPLDVCDERTLTT